MKKDVTNHFKKGDLSLEELKSFLLELDSSNKNLDLITKQEQFAKIMSLISSNNEEEMLKYINDFTDKVNEASKEIQDANKQKEKIEEKEKLDTYLNNVIKKKLK